MTDEQILNIAADYRSTYNHAGTSFDDFDELGFARALLAALPTPAPTMVDGQYPPLPDTDYRLYEAGARDGYGDAYDADQMRAYVDADRATRPTLQSLGGDAGVSDGWVSFADRLPPDLPATDDPSVMVSPRVFVTNNIHAKTRTGRPANVWYVYPLRDESNDEWFAFDESVGKIYNLTHWFDPFASLPAAPKAAEKSGRSE